MVAIGRCVGDHHHVLVLCQPVPDRRDRFLFWRRLPTSRMAQLAPLLGLRDAVVGNDVLTAVPTAGRRAECPARAVSHRVSAVQLRCDGEPCTFCCQGQLRLFTTKLESRGTQAGILPTVLLRANMHVTDVCWLL